MSSAASLPAPPSTEPINLLPVTDAELQAIRLAIAVAQSALRQRITQCREDVRFWTQQPPSFAHNLAMANENQYVAERHFAEIEAALPVSTRAVLRAQPR